MFYEYRFSRKYSLLSASNFPQIIKIRFNFFRYDFTASSGNKASRTLFTPPTQRFQRNNKIPCECRELVSGF